MCSKSVLTALETLLSAACKLIKNYPCRNDKLPFMSEHPHNLVNNTHIHPIHSSIFENDSIKKNQHIGQAKLQNNNNYLNLWIVK